MKMIVRVVVLVLSAVALSALSNLAAESGVKVRPLERVPRVIAVEYAYEKSMPPNFVVRVIGEVPSVGWTDVQLLRRAYVKPPADGIWEYDLVARPPSGRAKATPTQVTAGDRWTGMEEILAGVRIYGVDSGVREVRFTSGD